MKAVIVNCFDTYEDRVDLIQEFFLKKGYDVTVIQSDFRHFLKEKRKEEKQGFIFINTKSYTKNLSIGRLTSHYNFAKNAFKVVEELEPELLYVMLPPNSLSKFATKYKIKNKNTKLIFDLIDLWPETMPIGKNKKFYPFIFWKSLRDKGLKYADFIITECDLYQEALRDILKGIKNKTIYLAKKDINIVSNPQLGEKEIHLCYLGSINNIIDITKIKKIIKAINKYKQVTLHIIGDGENKDELINAAKAADAVIEYHGNIYNFQEKQEIMDRCHFGINVMKDSVCVGLTMKSLDYFQHGLPILNNIKYDTNKIVEKYNVGFNVSDKNVEGIAEIISNSDTKRLNEMRKNTTTVFQELFSQESFEKQLNIVMRELE